MFCVVRQARFESFQVGSQYQLIWAVATAFDSRYKFGGMKNKRQPFIRGGLLALVFLLACTQLAELRAEGAATAPVVVQPSSLVFAGPPAIPGLTAAWAIGSEKGEGLYLLRVRLKAGSTLPPHTHPDARVTTVLNGLVAVGFGDSFDESRLVLVHSGESYLVPAGQPHFIVARDGDAEYQEMGSGGTGTEMIKR